MASADERSGEGAANGGNSGQHINVNIPAAVSIPPGPRYMIRLNTPGQAGVRHVSI